MSGRGKEKGENKKIKCWLKFLKKEEEECYLLRHMFTGVFFAKPPIRATVGFIWLDSLRQYNTSVITLIIVGKLAKFFTLLNAFDEN